MNLAEITAMYDFTGKTFLVTGGTGVLGGELAGGPGAADGGDQLKAIKDYQHLYGI
ncbi:MAG: hypothetical protein HGA87_07395 [Desulfobulbaceae bacterium]|nr:hypothetical protein [Desulfobulbaceae bacterium]